MTTDEILALEALARGATEGTWRAVDRGTGWEIHRDGVRPPPVLHRKPFECWCGNPACIGALPSGLRADHVERDARFIAGAQPAAVLALIERIRFLEEERDVVLAVALPKMDEDALLALAQSLEANRMQSP
jgi:hypothetical protein